MSVKESEFSWIVEFRQQTVAEGVAMVWAENIITVTKMSRMGEWDKYYVNVTTNH
jgi:hypothetical protein